MRHDDESFEKAVVFSVIRPEMKCRPQLGQTEDAPNETRAAHSNRRTVLENAMPRHTMPARARLVTAEEFARIAEEDDDQHYELVEGRVVRMSPPGGPSRRARRPASPLCCITMSTPIVSAPS